MIYTFLKQYNPNLELIPLLHNFNKKSHGLQDEEIMDILRNSEPSLLWISDAGSSDIKECKELSELGYKIVVGGDHHQYVNNPYAIVVNNQDNSVTNKNGCGCLVTWHVLHKLNPTIANSLISYVMIATIGDSMNLASDENYTFTKWGKLRIHKNLQPFVNEFNKGLDNKSFSFGLISKMNATIRLGELEDKQHLFQSLCGEWDSSDIIDRMKQLHSKQVKECKRLTDEILPTIDVSKNYVLTRMSEKTPLTGLVANRIMSATNKPTLLVHERENDEIAGSVRSNIDGFRDMLNKSGLFNFNSGHSSIFGTSYQLQKEQDIISYLDTITSDLKPYSEVILSCTHNSLPNELFYLYEQGNALGVYGQGIQIPTIHIKPFRINGRDLQSLGRGTTLKLKQQDYDIMFFFMSKEKCEQLYVGKNKNYKIEIIGELGINEFRGKRTKQIIVQDYEIRDDELSIEDIF